MHVAFFNRSYHPDQTATGQLLTDLAEGLVRDHGWRVSVVTGPPLQPLPGAAFATGRPVARESHQGVAVHRAAGTAFDKRRFAGRASNYLTYFATACWAGLRLDRPDVVVAQTDPPIIGLAAWLAARRFGVPFVMAFKDLFPEVTVLLPDFHSDVVDRGLQLVNRLLVRRATVNVALGPTMRHRLIDDKGAAPDRTVIIADWADTSAIVPTPKTNGFATTHGLADRFVVMYSGNLGFAQGLETIVEAATLLADEPAIRFVFQGDGAMRPELERQARERGLRNVTFLPFAPRTALAESFGSADLFVIALQEGLAGYIVPSKLYGILAAGRPYVAAVETTCEVAAITRAGDCGVVVEPGNARALADGVRAFYRDPARTRACGERAREMARQYDRRTQVARYAALLTAVARRGPVTVGEGAVVQAEP